MFARLRVAVVVLCLLLFGSAIAPAAMAVPTFTVYPPVYMASLFHFSGQRPDNLGVKGDRLAPCPSSPNCVSSHSDDSEHSIAPLTYDTTSEAAIARLKDLLQTTENAEIIEAKPNYLYAEFTSKLMGFVDDVEFFAPEGEGVVHVRSASRLGQSDLGVNRQRIEDLRKQFDG
ncbi:DUF1499 domain-containing protein [Baaleninema simplex]|uniref:DUF1499 domain-containing protein n=1 Tax=Baaleninema simplex TaxID=2862350 RepID=UPI000345B265|nr:DUF1499 domain-containing protein [Baaleninema simplex]